MDKVLSLYVQIKKKIMMAYLFNGERKFGKLSCGVCGSALGVRDPQPAKTYFAVSGVVTPVYNQLYISLPAPCCGSKLYIQWGIN